VALTSGCEAVGPLATESPSLESGRPPLTRVFHDLALRERPFIVVVSLGFLAAAISTPFAAAAAWVGFLFAGYSAVANDSIQTIGTFIASNRGQKWWLLWLFIGGIFLATVGYSWWVFDGDVSYQRLAAKGFEHSPTSFSFLQVAAPIFLMIMTRLRMPVSTTFLLLTSFSSSANGVGAMLAKSLTGYALAFGSSIVLFLALAPAFKRWFRGAAHPGWRVGQWATSGVLWSIWLIQDAANIAVYLPRQLAAGEFAVFALVVFLGLGVLFKMGGEKIQRVVDEKSEVFDVRPATVIDLLYAVILFVFTVVSTVPMSTTWVFVGLLGGRELGIALRGASDRSPRRALALLGRDLAYVTVGLVLSIVIAAAVNQALRDQVLATLGG